MNKLVIVPQNIRLRIMAVKHFSLLIVLAAPLYISAEDSVGMTDNSVRPVDITENNLIYKTVDAQGRVSFGDKPAADAVELETLERPKYQENASTEELQVRLEQMAATTKRLQEDRKLRSKLRQEEAESKKIQDPAPVVVVENRVYRSRSYPYLYQPHRYKNEKKRNSHRSSSSLGLHLGGGNSRFHYGLSYGNRQRNSESSTIQAPYRRGQEPLRSPRRIKQRQN
jgi:hypothetical protein